MISGEIPIELGASWFSPKCVEAQPYIMSYSKVKHCFDAGHKMIPNRGKLKILNMLSISE